jgi:hypothetical protein
MISTISFSYSQTCPTPCFLPCLRVSSCNSYGAYCIQGQNNNYCLLQVNTTLMNISNQKFVINPMSSLSGGTKCEICGTILGRGTTAEQIWTAMSALPVIGSFVSVIQGAVFQNWYELSLGLVESIISVAVGISSLDFIDFYGIFITGDAEGAVSATITVTEKVANMFVESDFTSGICGPIVLSNTNGKLKMFEAMGAQLWNTIVLLMLNCQLPGCGMNGFALYTVTNIYNNFNKQSINDMLRFQAYVTGAINKANNCYTSDNNNIISDFSSVTNLVTKFSHFDILPDVINKIGNLDFGDKYDIFQANVIGFSIGVRCSPKFDTFNGQRYTFSTNSWSAVNECGSPGDSCSSNDDCTIAPPNTPCSKLLALACYGGICGGTFNPNFLICCVSNSNCSVNVINQICYQNKCIALPQLIPSTSLQPLMTKQMKKNVPLNVVQCHENSECSKRLPICENQICVSGPTTKHLIVSRIVHPLPLILPPGISKIKFKS